MKVLKGLINIFIAFIMVIIVIIILGKNLMSNKFLNKNYLLSKMEEMQVYLQISRDVKSGFENYIYQSGLPENTIDNLYTDEMIKSDTNSIVDYIYDGTEIKLSDDIVKANLEKKISEYLESQGLKINNQGRKNIEEFEDLIINEYKTNINVDEYNSSLKIYPTIHEVIQKLKDIDKKINYIPVIILVFLLSVLIVINKNNLLVALQYISISSLSIGVLLKMAVSLIFKNFDIDNFVLFSTSMTNLIINIIKEILYTFSDNANIFIVCGVIGILITSIINNISNKENA